MWYADSMTDLLFFFLIIHPYINNKLIISYLLCFERNYLFLILLSRLFTEKYILVSIMFLSQTQAAKHYLRRRWVKNKLRRAIDAVDCTKTKCNGLSTASIAWKQIAKSFLPRRRVENKMRWPIYGVDYKKTNYGVFSTASMSRK